MANIMISEEYASIEMDKENKKLIVKAKTKIGSDEMRKIIDVVVRETDERALDVAENWTMDIDFNCKK
jgi:hypothetical protein